MRPICKLPVVVLCGWMILLMLGGQAARGGELQAGIYFDGSGSMKGFFHDNGASIRDINARLHNVLTAVHIQDTLSSVFVSSGDDTRMVSLEAHLQNPRWGSETRLDAALASAQDRDIVLLVSDNVQDSGAYGTSSTMNFYQMFEADTVAAVLLVPLRFSFNGPLYFYRNRHPDRDRLVASLARDNPQATVTAASRQGKTYQVVTYQGDKALILYAVFKKGIPAERVKAFTKRLEEEFGALPLMVKPVDQGNFVLEGVSTKDEVTRSFNSFESLCGPGDGEKKIAVPIPNLQLKSPQLDFYQARVDDGRPQLQLLPEQGVLPVYPADRSKHLRFYARIVNRSATTVLGPPVELEPCSDKIRMELKQVSFNIPRSWQRCFFRPASVAAHIRPDYIPRLVNTKGPGRKGTAEAPGHHADFVMSNQLKVPRLKPYLDIAHPFDSMGNLVKLAFCRQIPMSVKGTLAVHVPAGHFSVDATYGKQYFTRSVFDQQRIYSPEDIVAYINISATTLEYDFVSRQLVLVPPGWIKAVVFATLGALLLLALATGISLTRTVCLQFDDGSKPVLRVALARPFASGVYVHNGHTVFRVKKQIFGYYAYPGDGFHFTDMSDAVLPAARLKSDESFQISGPDWPSVIAKATACSGETADCEVVELSAGGNTSQEKPLDSDEEDLYGDESEYMDSTDKGEA